MVSKPGQSPAERFGPTILSNGSFDGIEINAIENEYPPITGHLLQAN